MQDLLDYIGWQRAKWQEWMRLATSQGILELAAGPGGDGRFQKLADLVRHIFSAEKRYIERLAQLP